MAKEYKSPRELAQMIADPFGGWSGIRLTTLDDQALHGAGTNYGCSSFGAGDR